jgi:ankyrin repeat and BTB/POZ domain-containing protein 1
MDTKRKFEIEAALAKEAQAVSSGLLKEDNPLDTSENFRLFCEACRRGDLKVCQEMIQSGVNINSRDRHDYTPLILVSTHPAHVVYIQSCHYGPIAHSSQVTTELQG